MDYRDVFLKASDKTNLHGWMILQPKDKMRQAPTVIFMHENAGNIGLRMDYFHSLH